MKIATLFALFLCLGLFAFTAVPSVIGQDSIISPAQDDLVSSAYRVLKQRGLEPLTKVSSFYVLAVLNENSKKAFGLIGTSEEFRKYLTESDEIKSFIKVAKGTAEIDLVGFRFYSTTVVSLVYLITTERGPICLRLNLFTPDKKVALQGIQMTTEWPEMDEILDSVTLLPATLNLKLKLEELQAAD